MKCRTYTVDSFKNGKYFCHSCHRRLYNDMLHSANIKALNGMNINCDFCKKGKIKILPSEKLKLEWKQEETKNEIPIHT